MTDANAPTPGSLLFSITEPHRGQARAFHRWYERDHFHAGVMSGPGFFAGRRWVAPRALRALRQSEDEGTPAHDPTAGNFCVTYFIAPDAHEVAVDWAIRRARTLAKQGRMFAAADQVFTSFFAYAGATARDADAVPPALALDHPFAGLAVLMLDAHAQPRPRDLPAALCLGFVPLPLPASALRSTPAPVPRLRTLLLYFLDRDPGDAWPAFSRHAHALAEDARAGILGAAAFLPTVPGTDRHVDE